MSQETGILCKSCNKILNSQDDIFGTSCGHLYHFSCIQEFHGKCAKCMHCNAYKPMMFKMFMEFGKVSQTIPYEDQHKSLEVFNQLEETKKANAFLKKAFKISQETIHKHEANIKDLKTSLQEKKNIVDALEDRIATLEEKLSNINDSTNAEARSNGTISKKYNSTQYKWNQKEPNDSKTFLQQQRNNGENRNDDEKDIIANNEEIEVKSKEKLDDSIPPNAVMIRNFREIDLKDEPFENILFLAKQMKVYLSRVQIKDLFIFSERPSYYTLVVEFSDEIIKKEFLKKKHILQHNPKTRYLVFV